MASAFDLQWPSAVSKRFGSSLGVSLSTFIRHPRMVGSAFPASRWLVRRMLEPIDWSGIRTFVEYGPGTGVFTREVLRRLPADAVVLAVDTSAAFVEHLATSIDDGRLIAVQACAGEVRHLLAKFGLPQVDCILSGLPFSTLSPDEASRIMTESRSVLAPSAMFCSYQMRRAILPLLTDHVGPVKASYEWRNIPPCHLYWARASLKGGWESSVVGGASLPHERIRRRVGTNRSQT